MRPDHGSWSLEPIIEISLWNTIAGLGTENFVLIQIKSKFLVPEN